jgi:hypothetical protein
LKAEIPLGFVESGPELIDRCSNPVEVHFRAVQQEQAFDVPTVPIAPGNRLQHDQIIAGCPRVSSAAASAPSA